MARTPSEDLRAARAAILDRTDLDGAEVRARLTDVTDAVLRGLLPQRPGLALVAVGAYGRRDPVPGSDLDLVLVHRDAPDVAAVADAVWYPLWDSGVGLDHSVRTVAEAVAVAAADLRAALGLLDVRHVAGDEALAAELRAAVLAGWRRDARRRLPELVEAVAVRGRAAGELAFLLEPDLKEARGGLRDVQLIRALAAGQLADPPTPRVRSAETLLLDVRLALHRRSGRRSDRLVRQDQDGVAAALGLPDADVLMTAVYDAGRAVAWATDGLLRRAGRATAPRRFGRLAARPGAGRRPLAEGVVAHDGEVVLAVSARPADDPALLVRAAAAAAHHGLPLAPYTLDRLVAEAAPVPEPWPAEVLDAFLGLLGAGPAAVPVVEALDQAGLWVRLLPEWARVRCRPQRSPVHRFTVDRHLVEAAANAAGLTRRVARPDLLLLGALLHDVGKGWPGDHTAAGMRLVAATGLRLGLAEADVATLIRLVEHHLLLPETATRRDLDDPATVAAVARAVGDRDTLDLLHALTEADARATGPAAWTDWRAGLVADLVRRTAATLAGAPPPPPPALTDRQRALAAGRGPAIDVDGDVVTVVAPDAPGLLWRWAAVLAVHRLDVRAAAATSVGPTAVTVFTVHPRFGTPPDWALVRDDVRRAYDDPAPLERRLAERERAYAADTAAAGVDARVLFDDEASADATVVEVRAPDAVGLLHRVARALADCGLDVGRARIATLGAEAVDAFYVTEPGGRRLDPARREQVHRRVLAALYAGPAS